MEENSLIFLTKNELWFLHDSVTLETVEGEKRGKVQTGATTASYVVTWNTLRKIGNGLLELSNENAPRELQISFEKDDLLKIREIAKSSKKTGNELVGVNLALKVYKALEEIENRNLLDGFGTAKESAPKLSKDDIRSKLEQMEGENKNA